MPIILPTTEHCSAATLVRISRLLSQGYNVQTALARIRFENRRNQQYLDAEHARAGA